MIKNHALSVEEFFQQCALSSNQTFDNFKQLLHKLEDENECLKARKSLVEIIQFHQNYTENDFLSKYHFSFIQVDISNKKDATEPLLLLQFPSTFTPEDWSYTFFEGLSRYEFSEFNTKTLVELGCGNGWITIGLAKKYNPKRIYGLDINPRAIIASKINLFINSIDAQGNLILDHEGKSLLDKVEFQESDLLGCFDGKTAVFDSIVGCIPQVLSPSDDIFDNIISENQNDAFLYSLSNYCGKQGYIEDQFGLGLIAKAVEQSIDLLKPNGKLILNLGGRPGEQVLERLFKRRGLTVQKIWQRRVLQAEDTEIDPLVEIENKSPHRFEFFLGLNSNEPISAKTAKQYLQQGGTISHTLSVYEFTINQHQEIANIFNLLKDPDFKGTLSGLDLALSNKVETEEKINFLSDLSLILKNTSFFPYAETEGEVTFRNRLAQFFNSYFYTNFSKNHFVITPSRLSTINNILHIYQPELIIVDRDFSRIASIDDNSENINIIESPTSSNELCSLIERIKPQMVITTINEKQISQVDSFKTILEACKKANSKLIIDISPYIELSSNPRKIGVLSYAAEIGLPSYCSIICGLTNNKVYNDLELCMFISEDEHILKYLSFSAEFTYSRTPILSQEYYSGLIFELLKFQMTNMRESNAHLLLERDDSTSFTHAQDHVLDAFSHPSIKGNILPVTKETVRLDYGENELPSSKHVKVAIFESFVRQHLTDDEINPSQEIRSIIKERFGIHTENEKIHFGNGVAPLFAAVVKACKAQNGTILFPEGAYGYFFATAKFYNVPVKIIKTEYDHSFKVSADNLAKSLEGVHNPFLFLNFPLVNPTGALYNSDETDQLFHALSASNVHVVIDCVFSGLEFNGLTPIDLNPFIERGLSYTLIGGISKEFSAGGLRFGYATTRDSTLDQAFENYVVDQPHKTITYTVKKLYQLLINKNASLLSDLNKQQAILQDRYKALNTVLIECGWKVLKPEGGLFLVASPEKYIGKKITVRDKTYTLSSNTINEALFYSVNLLINNDVWTGIPGYCRFVLSVEEEVFEKALEKLKAFDALV
ncbi:MAG: aminotransferase class I/II-fold pyridoxal phosphate-dependent enzyme [Crocinitomicaceae bacterium]|nr:aminotransferase class I/II-fold pyridoxal phosphate-dependent enzyme [Crocinitomicaceae bacterium]